MVLWADGFRCLFITMRSYARICSKLLLFHLLYVDFYLILSYYKPIFFIWNDRIQIILKFLVKFWKNFETVLKVKVSNWNQFDFESYHSFINLNHLSLLIPSSILLILLLCIFHYTLYLFLIYAIINAIITHNKIFHFAIDSCPLSTIYSFK